MRDKDRARGRRDPASGKEELLSRYIDELNAERAPKASRGGRPDADGVRAAARAVKSLLPYERPTRGFSRRLSRTAGTPVVALRRQAGMLRGVVALALAGLVTGAALLWFSLSGGPARELMARVQTAAFTPSVTGYTGVFHSPYRGEVEVTYLAPDKMLERNLATGLIMATNGEVYWSVDPLAGTAFLADDQTRWEGPLPPELSAVGWEFSEVEPTEVTMTDLGLETVAGRQTHKYLVEFSPGCLEVTGLYRTSNPPAWGGTGTPSTRLVSGATFPDQLIWVDDENDLVLRKSLAETGNPIIQGADPGEAGLDDMVFESITFSPPADPTIFDPPSFEGMAVTRRTSGELAVLASRAGVIAPEPEGTPPGWELGIATLTVYPAGAGDSPAGSAQPAGPEQVAAGQDWQLTWWYLVPEDPSRGPVGLRVDMASEDVLGDYSGEEVDLGQGVTGIYLDPIVGGGQESLTWRVDGIDYRLTDATVWLGCFDRSDLVVMAKSMLQALGE